MYVVKLNFEREIRSDAKLPLITPTLRWGKKFSPLYWDVVIQGDGSVRVNWGEDRCRARRVGRPTSVRMGWGGVNFLHPHLGVL